MIEKSNGFTLDVLTEIVESDSKQRYSMDESKKFIRANQGHSTQLVDIKFKEKTPPYVLYHGTSEKAVKDINLTGINRMSRQFVHISESLEIAKNVGTRHTGGSADKLRIYKIDTISMVKDNYKFYLSDNGVWLTHYIPTQYITLMTSI